MKILALDTTSAIASAALWSDGKVTVVKYGDRLRKHAETAVPLVEELLIEQRITAEDVDLFAVDIGPGSFTGIRIGVAAMNAIAYASGRKVIPVDSLSVLSEPFAAGGKPVMAMIDARSGNAYAALFQNGKALFGPATGTVTELIEKCPEGTVFAGDVAVNGILPPEDHRLPDAGMLARAAAGRTDTAVTAAVPMYLRPSQAERLKKER